MNRDLGNERREYTWDRLEESLLPGDPIELFCNWLEQALDSDNPDPTAMTLSTVERNGQPSSRIVLLKKVEEGKLVFYTNYHSRKSREIRAKARVAAHFYWPELERQVNIAGIARPIEDADSDLYFNSRPYESKITAWASPQSEVIPNREYLEKEFEKYRRKYQGPGGGSQAGLLGRVCHHPLQDRILAGGAEPVARPDRIFKER